ncbi:MAG: hypothetical protein DCC71_06580 [Proteobacteria bacterium]|nr:MAG: hypothetical protein DCC71_06580 [Pseudomonadota bacterium]
MRFFVRLIGSLFALGLVVMGLEMIAAESGEVVVLRTTGDDGQPRETRLWVVDESGRQWLRAGSPQSSWLLDIQREPAVEMERNGHTAPYTAVPDVSARQRLNVLFALKYGWADDYIAMLFGREDATPIRLDPR